MGQTRGTSHPEASGIRTLFEPGARRRKSPEVPNGAYSLWDDNGPALSAGGRLVSYLLGGATMNGKAP